MLPTEAAEITTVDPTPPAAADCSAAKRLPWATKGIVDCQDAANEPASTPPWENPAMYMTAGRTVAATAAPATPPPTSKTAAQEGVTFTTSGALSRATDCDTSSTHHSIERNRVAIHNRTKFRVVLCGIAVLK